MKTFRSLILKSSVMDDRKLSLLIDYIKRGEKSCKEAAENPLNRQPPRFYYMGKANAFSEVLELLEALKNK